MTPNKVRAEQGQRAESKHFKRYFRKATAILDPRRAERAHVKWDKLYFRRKARTQTGTKTPQMSLNIGWTHTHTHRCIYSERAQQDIDILHTHTQHGEDLGLSLCVCLPALHSSMHTI